MLLRATTDKRDVCRQRDVSRHFLPNKLERILREPHILAAAGHCIVSLRGVVFHGTRMQKRADIPMALKQTDRRRSRRARLLSPGSIPGAGHRHPRERQHRQPNDFLSAHDEVPPFDKSEGNVRMLSINCQFFTSPRMRPRFPRSFPFSSIACYLRRLTGKKYWWK